MIYAPVVIFFVAVLCVWTFRSSSDPNAAPRLALIAGLVGLASAVLTAYLIHDQSQKGASLSAVTHTNNVAVALLVAHVVLFVALLVKKD